MLNETNWTSAISRLRDVQVKLKAASFDASVAPSITGQDVTLRFFNQFSPLHI